MEADGLASGASVFRGQLALLQQLVQVLALEAPAAHTGDLVVVQPAGCREAVFGEGCLFGCELAKERAASPPEDR